LTFEFKYPKISLISSLKTITLKKFILFVLVCFSISLSAQHKVGVRAGLNYSKFNGPLEESEEFSFASGFHFGINYTYKLNDLIGFRGEVLYIQKGTEHFFKDSVDIYNIINPLNGASFIDYGKKELSMQLSNSYFSIPLTVQLQLDKKFEVFAGMSFDFLLGASGRGKKKYLSEATPNDIFYTQSYDHRYGSDVVGEFNQFVEQSGNSPGPDIIVDGEIIPLPKVVGAYYDLEGNTTETLERGDEVDNRIKGIDMSVLAGVNYFINPGFYIGTRLEYGLQDLTNQSVDFSLRDLDENNNLITRDDIDKNINIAISIGFRF